MLKKVSSLIALALTVSFVAPATSAHACHGGEDCGIDARAFMQLNGHYCSNRTDVLSKDEALAAAKVIASGHMNTEQFLTIYDKVCSSSKSTHIAKEVRYGRLDYRVFNEYLGHYCSNRTDVLSVDNTIDVARNVARGEIGPEQFRTIYDKTCSPSGAVSIAKEVRRGQLDYDSFNEYLGHYCDARTDVLSLGNTLEVSRDVARGNFSRRAFLGSYNKVCNVPFAIRVGKEAGRGELDFDVFNRILYTYCGSRSHYLGNDETIEIAELAGRREIKLETFLQAYNQTCDFDMSKQLGCAGQLGSLERTGSEKSANLSDESGTKAAGKAAPIAILESKTPGKSRID
ncbi:MAG: hypothetical protein HY074_05350 [Deltaproteobacteria bacterium]|nr:hypothetical protein [Deltaproteobacteria bacterium]